MTSPTDHPQNDVAFMRQALAWAAKGLGQAWPNPAVGCVIVKNGAVIGAGATAKGGRPHAETQALSDAGAAAKSATAYVTLEPCSHHAKTPPCTDALIEAGIARVVIGCTDPDPRVNGKGIAALQNAGISITSAICESDALLMNEGFFRRIQTGRPFISLKMATSSDGKMTTPEGQSPWITGEDARNYGHLLRATHDAVLTGIGTVLADDPLLTCRLSGLENRTPLRIVLDSNLRIPLSCKLLQSTDQGAVWVLTTENANSEKREALEKAGLRVEGIELTPEAVTAWLGAEGLTRLLVEAGPTLTRAFYDAKQVDKLYWFRAPHAIGEAGRGAFEQTPKELQPQTTLSLGKDTLEIYGLPLCSQE